MRRRHRQDKVGPSPSRYSPVEERQPIGIDELMTYNYRSDTLLSIFDCMLLGSDLHHRRESRLCDPVSKNGVITYTYSLPIVFFMIRYGIAPMSPAGLVHTQMDPACTVPFSSLDRCWS